MKRLIAEFEEQSFTQIIFPHQKTDWSQYLDEAKKCFTNIITTIAKFQKVLVISADIDDAKEYIKDLANITFIEYETDDTWARDCSALSVEHNNKIELYNFCFNGWGGKFDAHKDNSMSRAIAKYYNAELKDIDFILEGGGIESNGVDTILSTANTMLNKNRNNTLRQDQITKKLKDFFGATKILYLNHGYLEGDDTDSHIDTLARFIAKDKIAYIKCRDKTDPHFKELHKMEVELQHLAKEHKYKLIPLPFCDPIYFEGERLPATYANFLFVNGGVIVPTYGLKQDKEAIDIFKKLFPSRKVVGIDCSVLIRQHGSLHCVTMNFK